MNKTKQNHSLKWYLYYSIFSLFIVIGVFSVMHSYTSAIKSQLEYQQRIDGITANTIDDLVNSTPPVYAPQANLLGSILLIIFGAAGFLFTKFLYEKQVMPNV